MDLPKSDASSEGASASEAASIISMHDFLDFLKLTCQVNEHLQEDLVESQSKIDYNMLAQNPLINSLTQKKSACEVSANTVAERNAVQRQNALQTQSSSGSVDKKGKRDLC